MVRRFKSRAARLLAALMLSVVASGAVVVATAGPAQAATCSNNRFCWYDLNNLGGTQCTYYNPSNTWVQLTCLFDAGNSSRSTYDPACAVTSNRFVYMADWRDALGRVTALLATGDNQEKSSFSSLSTNYGTMNLNNSFDQIFVACAGMP